MNEIKALGKFNIPGLGDVFTADRRQHNFELLDLKGKNVVIDGVIYTVRGIERTLGIVPGPLVGLLVKEHEPIV